MRSATGDEADGVGSSMAGSASTVFDNCLVLDLALPKVRFLRAVFKSWGREINMR